jgi:hypothetical protein
VTVHSDIKGYATSDCMSVGGVLTLIFLEDTHVAKITPRSTLCHVISGSFLLPSRCYEANRRACPFAIYLATLTLAHLRQLDQSTHPLRSISGLPSEAEIASQWRRSWGCTAHEGKSTRNKISFPANPALKQPSQIVSYCHCV